MDISADTLLILLVSSFLPYHARFLRILFGLAHVIAKLVLQVWVIIDSGWGMESLAQVGEATRMGRALLERTAMENRRQVLAGGMRLV
jgi:hypothetical protein